MVASLLAPCSLVELKRAPTKLFGTYVAPMVSHRITTRQSSYRCSSRTNPTPHLSLMLRSQLPMSFRRCHISTRNVKMSKSSVSIPTQSLPNRVATLRSLPNHLSDLRSTRTPLRLVNTSVSVALPVISSTTCLPLVVFLRSLTLRWNANTSSGSMMGEMFPFTMFTELSKLLLLRHSIIQPSRRLFYTHPSISVKSILLPTNSKLWPTDLHMTLPCTTLIISSTWTIFHSTKLKRSLPLHSSTKLLNTVTLLWRSALFHPTILSSTNRSSLASRISQSRTFPG